MSSFVTVLNLKRETNVSTSLEELLLLDIVLS